MLRKTTFIFVMFLSVCAATYGQNINDTIVWGIGRDSNAGVVYDDTCQIKKEYEDQSPSGQLLIVKGQWYYILRSIWGDGKIRDRFSVFRQEKNKWVSIARGETFKNVVDLVVRYDSIKNELAFYSKYYEFDIKALKNKPYPTYEYIGRLPIIANSKNG